MGFQAGYGNLDCRAQARMPGPVLLQTEEGEVAERMKMMEDEGLERELDAIESIAEKIRKARRQ